MKTTKFISMMAIAASVMLTACSKDDNNDSTPAPTPSNTVNVSSNISSNTTWTSGKVYVLRGRVVVTAGATLTIEPGVIVKGQAGTGANASALLIARGAKIMAVGTADKPIIFTTYSDNIIPGQIESPNMSPDLNGYWGGVIILGKAKISINGNGVENQIEGIPTSDQNGLYGGNDNADNSGMLKYVSIRHGGSNIGSGNEINGLTLGGVGSGTTIENVEIVANQDDAIEWFGGTVSLKNVVSWNVGDDGLDTDQSWGGSVDNFFIITPAGHCFELDGPEGDNYNAGHTFTKGTIVSHEDGGVTSEDLINVDEDSHVDLMNLHFTNVQTGQKINLVTAPEVTFSDITIDVPQDSLAAHVNGPIPSGVTAGGSPVADKSVFAGWTWADAAGVLK